MSISLCTLFPKSAIDCLVTLIAAQEAGSPMSLKEAIDLWGRGSTWEDLVDSGFISRMPEAVTVTERGQAWLKEQGEVTKRTIVSMRMIAGRFRGVVEDNPEINAEGESESEVCSLILEQLPVGTRIVITYPDQPGREQREYDHYFR